MDKLILENIRLNNYQEIEHILKSINDNTILDNYLELFKTDNKIVNLINGRKLQNNVCNVFNIKIDKPKIKSDSERIDELLIKIENLESRIKILEHQCKFPL